MLKEILTGNRSSSYEESCWEPSSFRVEFSVVDHFDQPRAPDNLSGPILRVQEAQRCSPKVRECRKGLTRPGKASSLTSTLTWSGSISKFCYVIVQRKAWVDLPTARQSKRSLTSLTLLIVGSWSKFHPEAEGFQFGFQFFRIHGWTTYRFDLPLANIIMLLKTPFFPRTIV